MFFRYFITVIIASISVVASAQQTVRQGTFILFRGVVADAESLNRLSGARIYLNGFIKAVSRDDGTFSFFAEKNDTVVFSMLGYKPTELIVNDTLRATEFLAGIYLRPDTIAIGEVIILPRFSSLRAEMMNPQVSTDIFTENARNNLNIASYQGRTGQNRLGDPAVNYELLRQKQKMEAYEKGGIPSDRIVGLNPLILVPAAYLLIHGLPEKPAPPEPGITQKELDELNKAFLETVRKKK